MPFLGLEGRGKHFPVNPKYLVPKITDWGERLSMATKSKPKSSLDDAGAPFMAMDFSYLPPVLTLLPVADSKFLKLVTLSNEQWTLLEDSLGRPLPPLLRSAFTASCSHFFFSLVYRDKLPPSERYVALLLEKTLRAQHALECLVDLISPAVRVSSAVLDSQTHFSAHVARMIPDRGRSLVALSESLFDLELKLSDMGSPHQGAYGHYQLDPLYINLLRISRAAGASTKLNSHNDRYGKHFPFKPTPVVKFVAATFGVLLEMSGEVISRYDLEENQKTSTHSYLRKLLKKSPGNLILPLEAARKADRQETKARK